MASVTGRLEGRDLGSAVADIRTELDKLKLPVGYTYEIGGQYESQTQAFRELLTVFGLVSGWAYRRVGHPLPGAVANALALAWAIAVTFPVVAR